MCIPDQGWRRQLDTGQALKGIFPFALEIRKVPSSMLWHALQCTGDGFGWFALSAVCSVQMCTVKCAVCRCAVCTVCTSQCVQCAVQSAAAAALFLVCRGGAVKRRGEPASGCQSLSRSHLQVRFSHLQARLRGELQISSSLTYNSRSSSSLTSFRNSLSICVCVSFIRSEH